MINIKDEKVKEVLENLSNQIIRKSNQSNYSNSNIKLESKIIEKLCDNHDASPGEIAIALINDGVRTDKDAIAKRLKDMNIGNPVEREYIMNWAEEVADLIADSLDGVSESYDRLTELMVKYPTKSGHKIAVLDKLVLITLFYNYTEIDLGNNYELLQTFGTTLSKFVYLELLDSVKLTRKYTKSKEKDTEKPANKEDAEILKYKDIISNNNQKIESLEMSLNRTSEMLDEMQREFELQLEASKHTELTEFFSKLNSEKYGCILDELLSANKGIIKLKKQGYQLPLEINGIIIMVKKLIKFVQDSHIEPIMKLDSIEVVKAKDVEYCDYEGTPFVNNDEEKMVRVISSGWVYKDKGTQISRPKVKEEN